MEKFDKLKRAKLSCSNCGESLWYDQDGNYVCTCDADMGKMVSSVVRKPMQ